MWQSGWPHKCQCLGQQRGFRQSGSPQWGGWQPYGYHPGELMGSYFWLWGLCWLGDLPSSHHLVGMGVVPSPIPKTLGLSLLEVALAQGVPWGCLQWKGSSDFPPLLSQGGPPPRRRGTTSPPPSAPTHLLLIIVVHLQQADYFAPPNAGVP